MPHGLKKTLGRVGYLGWAAFQLTRFRPFKLTVGEGADAVTIDALEVRIANGAYHGGTELVEEAAVDSGEIVVQAVIGNARHRLIYSWAREHAEAARAQARRCANSTASRCASPPIRRCRSRSTARCWRRRR